MRESDQVWVQGPRGGVQLVKGTYWDHWATYLRRDSEKNETVRMGEATSTGIATHMKKRRLLTARGELMETPMSWEQQEVFRLLKSQPGTMPIKNQTNKVGTCLETGCVAC
jgi:predicted RNA-binding protein (virulence factor B family)